MRKDRARKHAAFLANPFVFTKLLEQKNSGQFICSKAEFNHYPRNNFQDESIEQDLGHCKSLISHVPHLHQNLNGKEPSWKEVKKVRANSAPGPSGVP